MFTDYHLVLFKQGIYHTEQEHFLCARVLNTAKLQYHMKPFHQADFLALLDNFTKIRDFSLHGAFHI